MAFPVFEVDITLRVDFSEKDKAKELKCYWSPEDKAWKKTFSSTYYVNYNATYDGQKIPGLCKYYNAILEFRNKVMNYDLYIKDDGEFENVKDYIEEHNLKCKKCSHRAVREGGVDDCFVCHKVDKKIEKSNWIARPVNSV